MKEKYIYSDTGTEGVRAILDNRKTQIRQVIKIKTVDVDGLHFNEIIKNYSPYQPGQKLWVRETWNTGHGVGQIYRPENVVYKADCFSNNRYKNIPICTGFKWKSPIRMLKKYARIWLEVTGIRVERLQDITENDAKAEGIKSTAKLTKDKSDYTGWYANELFQDLWDSINAKRGYYAWHHNPFCWVIKYWRIPNA